MQHFNLHFYQNFNLRSLITFLVLSCVGVGSLAVSGCNLKQDTQAVATVISSDEKGVQGCTFLQEIDTRARATLGNARYELKLAASKLGATHVVEMFAYAKPYNNLDWELGIALTGRAYWCDKGKGALQDIPSSYKELPYDMPHPGVNRDDPMTLGPVFPTYIGKPHP